jgi:CO/xanthine dehydrogenase Mo-binding subunit
MPNGRPWPRIGLRQCLEQLKAHPIWQEHRQQRARSADPSRGNNPAQSADSARANDPARPGDPAQPPAPYEGVGVAIGGLFGGLQSAGAICRLEGDGSLSIIVGSVDISGTNTGLVLMAAEALGIPPHRIRVVNADTDSAPFAGNAGGSKITLTVGTAVVQAAGAARSQIFAIAADQLEVAPEDLEMADGKVQVAGTPERSIGLDRIAQLSIANMGKYPPVLAHGSSAVEERAPGIAAHLARVRVDPDTHEPKVIGYVAVQDVGRAVNPAMVEEQIHGGVAQGIGWALYEGIVFDEDGRVLTGSWLDYAVPTAEKVPAIETVLLEIPSRSGPFGVRGVGEPPVIPGAAAIGNAIKDAVGVRLTEIPMTAQKLHRALTATAAASATPGPNGTVIASPDTAH